MGFQVRLYQRKTKNIFTKTSFFINMFVFLNEFNNLASNMEQICKYSKIHILGKKFFSTLHHSKTNLYFFVVLVNIDWFVVIRGPFCKHSITQDNLLGHLQDWTKKKRGRIYQVCPTHPSIF